jgi:hypothetical protein
MEVFCPTLLSEWWETCILGSCHDASSVSRTDGEIELALADRNPGIDKAHGDP